MSSVLSAAITILEFVVAFSLLMFFHEFGHFIVSKLFGIEVEEFGFGFPPKMVNLFKFKGTQISLNWIPFGAFVRPKAENDPTVKGVPKGWTLPIRDVLIYSGAKFLCPCAGTISLMPGTSSNPAFRRIDVDTETGKVSGLF